MIKPDTKNFLLLSASLLASIVLSGCGIGTSAANVPSAPVVVHGGIITGKVLGGQQPVENASIQLWAAGSAGYGTASTPLITGLAATTSNGTGVIGTTGNASNANNTLPAGYFTITGDFTCPTLAPDTPTYLTIMGGNPVGTGTNASLGLMAALGPCSNLSNIPFANVNEITTVATVWALSPFMTAFDHVGTSSTNVLGLTNAFATVNKLVDIASGLPSGPGLPVGAAVPVQEMYALGNILATCVNSTGSTGPSDTTTNCGRLFNLTTVGSVPANTIDAALSIAQNPANNVPGLFGQITSIGAAFVSTETQPTSWTIAISYTGSLNHPKGIAVDGSGNVWVPNAGTSQLSSSVSMLTPTATSVTQITGTQINQPSALAVDSAGNAWITNAGNSTITEIGPTGLAGSSFSGNGLNTPSGVAFDQSGNIWVSNSGANSISVFNNTGSTIGTYGNIGSINMPAGIAVNPRH